MGTLSVRLPNSTHEQLKELARQEDVSINQLLLTAVAEKISALRTARLYTALENPVTRSEFEAALEEVPDVEPDAWDAWTRSRRGPSAAR